MSSLIRQPVQTERTELTICKYRETNSIACHGAPGVSNTAGAALWVIDYTLQAATLGITEAYFHEGVGYKYNFVSTSFHLGIVARRS